MHLTLLTEAGLVAAEPGERRAVPFTASFDHSRSTNAARSRCHPAAIKIKEA